jgi:hypothetical protein
MERSVQSCSLRSMHIHQLVSCLSACPQGPKVDPLKGISVKGFAKAPRKGSHADEELTEMEVGVWGGTGTA